MKINKIFPQRIPCLRSHRRLILCRHSSKSGAARKPALAPASTWRPACTWPELPAAPRKPTLSPSSWPPRAASRPWDSRSSWPAQWPGACCAYCSPTRRPDGRLNFPKVVSASRECCRSFWTRTWAVDSAE
ncbi:hypothetical protein Mapa_014902 [Marchantia paleacea]|nr:hypothetical protein Mapa_014902 [Marchantia paleacea]